MFDISINNDVIVDNVVDAAIQELDMIFNTENTELIGYTDYGTNWLSFLWTLTPTVENIEQYIYEKISDTYFLKNFNPHVQVKFERGTERSIYYVKISLYDNVTGEVINIQQYELK